MTSQVVIHRAPPRLGRVSRVFMTLIVLAGVGSGAFYYANGSNGAPACGPTEAVALHVSAAPDIAPAVTQIAATWQATKPVASGRCVRVTVTADGGAIPTAGASDIAVWIPDSSVWINAAKARDQSAFDVPAIPIASSPLVFAVNPANKSVAKAAAGVMTDGRLDPAKLGDVIAGACQGKPAYLTFGLDDPARDAVGLATATWLRTELNDDACFMGVYRSVPHAADRSGLLATLVKGVDTVPASEQAVLAYDTNHKTNPLAALAFGEGGYSLDYPAAILAGLPVATATAAQAFRQVLTSTASGTTFAHAGFRTVQGSTAAGFVATPGLSTAPVTVHPVDGSNLVEMSKLWQAATKPANVLALMDLSPTMSRTDGTGVTRLQVLLGKAGGGLGLFNADDKLGLWAFGGNASANKVGYTAVVPPAALTPTQRTRITDAFQSASPSGGSDCGFVPAVLASYTYMAENYDPNRANTLIVFTDTTHACGSETIAGLESALQRLADTTRPIAVIMLSIGPDADQEALRGLFGDVFGSVFPITPDTSIERVFMQSLLKIAEAQ